jgi:hypothetical protein
MNKPTDLEVNKKLAEYMGEKDPYLFKRGDMRRVIYTESLDAQITIFKKLGFASMPFEFKDISHKHPNAKFHNKKCKDNFWNRENPRGIALSGSENDFDTDYDEVMGFIADKEFFGNGDCEI